MASHVLFALFYSIPIGMDKITSEHCQAIIYRKFGLFVSLPSAHFALERPFELYFYPGNGIFFFKIFSDKTVRCSMM